VKVDATIRGFDLAEVADWSRRCEEIGFDGIWSTETNHDPFFPLVVAAGVTSRVELGTGIALAFPRSPMHLAYAAWDLQALSHGRFVLGLGSQVRAHVTKRFSSEWSRPAARMREIVLAIRAIFEAWDSGEPLQFRGEMYRHVLMPPAFSPGPFPYGRPPVQIAAVGERMLEVAGEVADGILVHPLQTELYIRETLLPALARGLERGGRERGALEVSLAQFVVTNDEEAEEVRRRIAFYGSTPAYRHVLDLHGWGDVHEELYRLSRTNGWAEMPAVVTDEVLETVAVVAGSPEEAGRRLGERWKGLVDRVNLHAGEVSDPELWAGVVAALHAAA
jgi:probable F420-dependent oxidoreductase